MKMSEYMGWAKKRGWTSRRLHMWADTGCGVRPLCDPYYPPHIKAKPGDRIEQSYYRELNQAIDYEVCSKCRRQLPKEIGDNLHTQGYLPRKVGQ